MKINIPVCTRGTLKEFKESYQPEFLSKYGILHVCGGDPRFL